MKSPIARMREVRAMLAGAEGRGLCYGVVWLTDADFAVGSLLNRLTDERRKILILACELGYDDVSKDDKLRRARRSASPDRVDGRRAPQEGPITGC